MWDVFEHIVNPKEYLKKVFDMIETNGVLFLQVPNSNSIAAKVLQQKCNMYDGLEHVSLFSPETIKRTVDLAGFRVRDIKSVIPESYVLKNYLSYDDPYFPVLTQESPIFDFLTDDYILEKIDESVSEYHQGVFRNRSIVKFSRFLETNN